MRKIGAAIGRAETGIFFDDENFHSSTAQAAEGRRSERAAIRKHFRRSDAAAESHEIEKLAIETRGAQFDEELALLIVPVIREKAVFLLKTRDPSGQSRGLRRILRLEQDTT